MHRSALVRMRFVTRRYFQSTKKVVITMPGIPKIFELVHEEDVVIVVPQGAARQFPYREVHMESNALLRDLRASDIQNVIVDLERLDFIDSVMIDSILRILMIARNRGGCAAFCNVSEQLQEILSNIRLGDMWPQFPTRHDALASIRRSDAD